MEESCAVSEELDSPYEVQQGGVDDLVHKHFSEGVIDDVSLREVFEIEDRGLDKRIADIGKQIGSIKLS